MLTYAAYYLLMQLQNTHLPGLFTSYGPIILLGILVVLFLSGAIGLLLGLVLATVNPLLGGICTFFFSRTIGRHLTKTIITTVLFLLFLTVLTRLGYAYI